MASRLAAKKVEIFISTMLRSDFLQELDLYNWEFNESNCNGRMRLTTVLRNSQVS